MLIFNKVSEVANIKKLLSIISPVEKLEVVIEPDLRSEKLEG